MQSKAQTLQQGISESKDDEMKLNDILIFDTGGGKNRTITKQVWAVFETTNHRQEIWGYQDNLGRKYAQLLIL